MTERIYKQMNSRLYSVLSLGSILFGCTCALAGAAASGVSYFPTVIDFGKIPSNEQPTQLLTVTFDRPEFSPDHLPVLRLQGPNGPVLSLFSRTLAPDNITLVYRVKLLNYREYGMFQYRLVLVKAGADLTSEVAAKDILDSGVLVQGEILQGLEGSPEFINFGPVRYEKGAAKNFVIDFFHSDFVRWDEFSGKAPKTVSWSQTRSLESMSVTSNSPNFTALKGQVIGMNASAWMNWQIVLSRKAPQKKLEAELVFQTGDGYSLTVPVDADLSGTGYPIPPREPSRRGRH